MNERQVEIKRWFDWVYQKKSFSYLRPPEAYDIFISILKPKENGIALDVACGLGLLLKKLIEKGVISYGIDISTEAINQSKTYCPEANLTIGNAENLPFDNNTFDYITCIGSLERMLDRRKVLAEQKRVAKKNATFCYMVRNSENFTWKYLLNPLKLKNSSGNQDALSYDEWKNLFESCGLQILNVYPDHWPYLRLRKSLFPFRTDYGKLRRFPFNICYAYEFIFLLSKNE